MKEKVLLHTAFWWDCPECGTENYHRGISCDFSQEDLAEIRDKYRDDIDELLEGEWFLAPEKVKCVKCQNEFEAMDDRDIDLGDFDD